MFKVRRENLQMICRTCLNRLQSIDSAKTHNIRETPDLTKLLIVCTSININEDADAIYPQRICSKCYETLNEFKHFREMCIKSSEILRGFAENSDGVLIAENEPDRHQNSYKNETTADNDSDNFEMTQTELSDSYYAIYEEETEDDPLIDKEIKMEESHSTYGNPLESVVENEADVSIGDAIYASTSKDANKRKHNDDIANTESFTCRVDNCGAAFNTSRALQIHWKECHDADFSTVSELPSDSPTKQNPKKLRGNLKVTNQKQFRILVDEMKKYPDIAQGFYRRNPGEICDFWKDMVAKLNSNGPPSKHPRAWRKVWSDYKFSIKRKLKAQEMGEIEDLRLNQLEEEVNALMNVEISLAPLAGRPEFISTAVMRETAPKACSWKSTDEQNPTEDLFEKCIDSKKMEDNNSNTYIDKSTEILKKQNMAAEVEKIPLTTNGLLQKQIGIQEELLKTVTYGFEIIKRQNEIDLNDEVRQILNKINENEASKTTLMQEATKEQKRHNSEIKKLSIKKLEIEKKMLEIKQEKNNS